MQTYTQYMTEVERLRRDEPLFQKVEVEINLGCNRRCGYCFLATRRRESVVATKRRDMDMGLYEMLLSQLSDLNYCGEVNFHFYAEPLLCKLLPEYVRRARQQLPAIGMVLYTNGDLLTEDKMLKLKTAGLNAFYITSHDDCIPDHLRDIVTRPDVIFETRSIMILNNRGGYLGSNQVNALRTLPCVYPSLTMVVTIDGNVLPCSCDFDEQMCFGNIGRLHLRDIWASTKAREFRKALLAGKRAEHALCVDCDWYSDVLQLPSAAEAKRYAPDGPGPKAIIPATREI